MAMNRDEVETDKIIFPLEGKIAALYIRESKNCDIRTQMKKCETCIKRYDLIKYEYIYFDSELNCYDDYDKLIEDSNKKLFDVVVISSLDIFDDDELGISKIFKINGIVKLCKDSEKVRSYYEFLSIFEKIDAMESECIRQREIQDSQILTES